jgi:parallel beta-helix repeat protein
MPIGARRVNAILIVMVLLAAVALIALEATRTEGGPLDPPSAALQTDGVRLPGTPIDRPTTISAPGHYYLTRDVEVFGAVTAITIASSNVSLDLGGFMIDGSDTVGSVGITTFGSIENVEIVNGRVRDFHIGISTGSLVTRIDNVHVSSSIRGFSALGNETVLSNCSATQNDETGIYFPGSDGVIQNCSVISNVKDGISLAGSRNLVVQSVIGNNATTSAFATLRVNGVANTVRENVFYGGSSIRIETERHWIVDNVCYSVLIADVSETPANNVKAAADHLNVRCT